jgi:hypothetical protein
MIDLEQQVVPQRQMLDVFHRVMGVNRMGLLICVCPFVCHRMAQSMALLSEAYEGLVSDLESATGFSSGKHHAAGGPVDLDYRENCEEELPSEWLILSTHQ